MTSKPTLRFGLCKLGCMALAGAMLLALAGCSGSARPVPAATATADLAAAPRLSLIPAPTRWEAREGQLRLAAGARIHADGSSAAEAAALRIEQLSGRLHGFNPLRAESTQEASIILRLDEAAGLPLEAYRLEIDAERVEAVASTASGLFHAATSLVLLMEADAQGAVELPQLRIDDAPRFGWRGLMLDSARHAQSVSEIKHLIDAMALHKLNVLHWHLTDDQGWRIEIKRHPRLTGVGGCRVPAGAAGQGPEGIVKPYCAHYTQDEVRELVAYAQARHIEIVPEIDMPGHAQAAVAAYPELGLMDPPPPVSADWGVHRVLFNVEEPTLRVLEDVMEEVVELFPGRFVHIGGDEAVKDQWEQSPTVQARMRELGVDSETALQAWLIARMRSFLGERQRRMIGWDEILDGELPQDAIVMSWRGTEGGLVAARRGHDVVMSPSTDLYFDFLQSASEAEVPGRPSMIPLSKVYAYEPIPEGLEAAHHAHILGLQANIWTEHLRRYDRVQHAAFPRLAALAERGWSRPDRRDFGEFLVRLGVLQSAYSALDIRAAQTPFEVLAELRAHSGVQGSETFQLSLVSALDGTRIHYTLDGSAPTAQSPLYSVPIEVQLPAHLSAQPFVGDTPVGTVTRRDLGVAGTRVRSSRQLAPATGGLVLRLEDDTPAANGDDTRTRFDVEIFNPRWIWQQPALNASTRLRVRAGRIPYNFQLHKEESLRRFVPARTPHGELRVEAGCDGVLLAEVPLPADTDESGFLELEFELAPAPASMEAARDHTIDALCLRFSGDTRPHMWVLDQAELILAAAPGKEN